MERKIIIEKEYAPITVHQDGFGYYINWDYIPAYDEGERQSHGTCLSVHCPYRNPTMTLIRQLVKMEYNQDTTERIVAGFRWRGKRVYLTNENQTNYKSAFFHAKLSGGENLPYWIKIGDEGDEEYVEFKTLEEIEEFYNAMSMHINDCIKEGWNAKDSVDWHAFEVALKNLPELPQDMDLLTNTLP